MSDSFGSIVNRNYNKCKTKYILPRKNNNTQTSVANTQIESDTNTNIDAPVPNVFAWLSFPISNYGNLTDPNTGDPIQVTIFKTTSYYSCINLIDKIPVGRTIDISKISTSVSEASPSSLDRIEVGIYNTSTLNLFDTANFTTSGGNMITSNCIARESFTITDSITTTSRITIELPGITNLVSSPNIYYFVCIAFIFKELTEDLAPVSFPAPATTADGQYTSFSYVNDNETANHNIVLNEPMLMKDNISGELGVPYFSLS